MENSNPTRKERGYYYEIKSLVGNNSLLSFAGGKVSFSCSKFWGGEMTTMCHVY